MNPDSDIFAENYITDHLGNVRVAYTVNTAGTALVTRQVDSYYPFGMNIRELTASLSGSDRPNEYLYNGKMFQDEGGLNWLDYGARIYDAILGRFHVPDPLVELHQNYTPFAYCYNNSIRLIDQLGLDTTDTQRKATPEEMEKFNKAKKQGTTIYQAPKEDDSNDPSSPNYNSQESHGRAINYPDGMDWRYRPETASFMWLGAATEDILFSWVGAVGEAYRTLTNDKASTNDKVGASFNAALSLAFGLPGGKPSGKISRLNAGEIKFLEKNGYDIHSIKPEQGGTGGKIDLYKDSKGNLFYKTEKGSFYEPIFENIKSLKK